VELTDKEQLKTMGIIQDLDETIAPEKQFTDHGDGTVTDNFTGLMWTKDANLAGIKTWQEALDYVANMNTGSGTYGHTDWRLPNVKELASLVDYAEYHVALPTDHPYTDVQSVFYWSSSTDAYNPSAAWVVGMYGGSTYEYDKDYCYCVWPVRGGR
jgi:hypothetical protein